jgi:hypothetical protein
MGSSPILEATSPDFADAFAPGEEGLDRERLLRTADAARLEMEELAS